MLKGTDAYAITDGLLALADITRIVTPASYDAWFRVIADGESNGVVV
jgi:hypothetical protein